MAGRKRKAASTRKIQKTAPAANTKRGAPRRSQRRRPMSSDEDEDSIEEITISSDTSDTDGEFESPPLKRLRQSSSRTRIQVEKQKDEPSRKSPEVFTISGGDKGLELVRRSPRFAVPVNATVTRTRRKLSSTITKECVVRLVRLPLEKLGISFPTKLSVVVQEEELDESQFTIKDDDQLEIETEIPSAVAVAVVQEERPNESSVSALDIDDAEKSGIMEEEKQTVLEEPYESKFCSIADVDMDDEGKLQVMDSMMDLDRMQRFQCYLHSGLNLNTVRSLMQRISKNTVDDLSVWAVCDLVKDHVEDIVNNALDFDEACGDNGPLSPIAILTASFEMKLKERGDSPDGAD